MMNTAQQLATFGVSAEAIAGQVRIQTGPGGAELDPTAAQRFAFYLAHAYMHAGGPPRRSAGGNVIIGGAR
jgi:hypothetical protein